MTNRTLVRDRLGALGWQRGSEYRGNRVTQVETMERHNVCRQNISDLRSGNLREYLAHLV